MRVVTGLGTDVKRREEEMEAKRETDRWCGSLVKQASCSAKVLYLAVKSVGAESCPG